MAEPDYILIFFIKENEHMASFANKECYESQSRYQQLLTLPMTIKVIVSKCFIALG